jgi:YbgC/YbaW family acyl-CoA thioester hydrolase
MDKFNIYQDVRISDLGYGVHLGYAHMVLLLHNARVAFLSNLGFSEIDCCGYSLMMSNINVDYKAECFLGDKLKFEVEVEIVDRLRICFNTTVTHEDSRVAAIAKDTMIFFDQNKRKPVRVPEQFKELITQNTEY